jgi:hypothetical protein
LTAVRQVESIGRTRNSLLRASIFNTERITDSGAL